jgi:ribosomal protein S18 acetylase RimI-like enzyme
MFVRTLTPGDAEAFRALRLEGLRLNPESFGAHVDDEKKLPVAEFARRITPTEGGWVLGAFDGSGVLRGVMGWFRERGAKRAHRSMLTGAYVQPQYRRSGYGAALLSTLLERVDAVPDLRQLQLHVWSENVAAKSLYAKFGFRFVAVHPESLRVDGRLIDEELWTLSLPRNA